MDDDQVAKIVKAVADNKRDAVGVRWQHIAVGFAPVLAACALFAFDSILEKISRNEQKIERVEEITRVLPLIQQQLENFSKVLTKIDNFMEEPRFSESEYRKEYHKYVEQNSESVSSMVDMIYKSERERQDILHRLDSLEKSIND